MTEAWILNVSYAFSGDQNVINYISFAATITSLLLAVLAIIYGFYQSDAQKKSVEASALQLESMRAVQQTLGVTAAGMAEHMKEISSTTAVLKNISESIDSTHAKVVSLEGGISDLRSVQENIQATLTSKGEKEPGQKQPLPIANDELAEKLLRRTSYQADLVGYSIYKGFSSAKKMEIPFWEFVQKFIAEPLAKEKFLGAGYETWYAVGTQLLMVLRAIGLLTITFNEDFKKSTISVLPDTLKMIEGFAETTRNMEKTRGPTLLIDAVQW